VPFYLLVRSGLTALEVSSILAVVQSAILWLTYELAVAAAPPERARVRFGLAICAVMLAFANPILINQIGTSFADILTAEVVLLGWVLLVRAIRAPSAVLIAWAAVILGCGSALKLTNAVHALSAGLLVLFVPVDWRSRCRYTALFALCMAVGFLAVSAPWSIRLEEHFGNPLFPLMNGIFHSPDFTTAPIIDYRFIPISLGAALWLPFAMIAPQTMVDVEWLAPDPRYALLLVAGLASLLVWLAKRTRGSERRSVDAIGSADRVLAALSCAFVADWTMWLRVSGNGRYFIPMACVAALLAIGLIFRLCAQHPKVRNYLLLAVFGVQFYQLHAGTEYPARLPWTGTPWFQVEMPKDLATDPALFFSLGDESNSFLAAYLAPGSGLVNLEGSYTLGPDGASGRHIESLIRRYSPHLQIVERDIRRDGYQEHVIPDAANENDALEPFGLKVDTNRCERIAVHGMPPPPIILDDGAVPKARAAETDVGYFVTCAVVASEVRDPALISRKRSADLALDHFEDACPALLQPAPTVTYLRTNKAREQIWVRKYGDTDMVAWIRGGGVYFQRIVGGGQESYAGPESAWRMQPCPSSAAGERTDTFCG